MRQISRWLLSLSVGLLLVFMGASLGPSEGSRRSVSAAPRADLVEGWNIILTSHHGSDGVHTGYGKWFYSDYNAFTCDNGRSCWVPYTDDHSGFQYTDYDDSAWNPEGRTRDSHPWDDMLEAELGRYYVSSTEGHPDNCTHLHRRWFDVPNANITSARLRVWSDNESEWWINGDRRRYGNEGGVQIANIPLSNLNIGGSNLLAVAVNNDNQPSGNPMGVQYIIEVYVESLACPTGLTATCLDDGDQVELSWDPLAGADDYLVRLNREPYDDFQNVDGGDQLFYTGGSTSVVRSIECGANYYFDVQGVVEGEAYPHDGCIQLYGPFNCPCPPSMQINAIDPDGNPVDVDEIFIAERNDDGFMGKWAPTLENCYDCSSCLIESGLTAGDYGVGGYVEEYPNQIILGATPSPSEGLNQPFWAPDGGYYWGGDHIAGVDFQMDVVLVTKTPTPTPTPRIEVNAIDTEGNSVDTAELGVSEVSYSWGRPFFTVPTEFCSDCSSVVESDVSLGTFGVGGYVTPYPNQVILGVTPDPDSGAMMFDDEGYAWWPEEVGSGIGGEHAVDYVLATMTPTPRIEVNAIDTDGNPVDAAELGVSKVDSPGGLPFFTDHTELCNDCSSVVESDVSLGTFGAGGYVTPYPDQILLGVTPDPDSGGQIREEGYAWWPDGGAGLSGDHAIDYVLATMTPVPGTIVAHVFNDYDGDGVLDNGEPGLPNIRIDLSSGDFGDTDSSGVFTSVQDPGTHTVTVDEDDSDLPTGMVPTTPTSQSVDLASSATEDVYFGFRVTLPCPTGLSATCSDLGGQVTLSWNAVTGADDYRVRMNREPYHDWPNPGAGDQDFFTGGATSVVRDIDSGYDYQWSVQPAKPGETPPLSGCVTDGPVFNCLCPRIQVYALDPDGNPVNVEEVGIAEMELDEFVGYWGTRLDRCYGCSSLTVDSGLTAGALGVGGYAAPHPDQVVLGVTPAPDTGHRRSNGYYWNGDGDMGSDNVVEVVLATMTPVPGEIIAHTFYDDDGDGVWDAGEAPMPYIRVDVGAVYDSTNTSGDVSFDKDPGSYTVEVAIWDSDIPSGAVSTTPQSQSVDLAAGETEHVYFGFRVPGGIIAHTFYDDDGDGVWDDGEAAMPEIRVDVSSGAHGSTNASGDVSFEEYPGSYTVEVDTSDGDIPADAVLTTAQSQGISLEAVETEHVYFGFRVPGTIIAYTFYDDDGDGVWDAGEAPLPDIRVDVSSGAYGWTDASGEEVFEEYPGYCVVDVDEDDTDIPAGATLTTSGAQGIVLDAEETEHVYFGFRVPGTIIAHTFRDDDGDGVWDAGEAPMSDIRIDVSSGSYGWTDASGEVTFEENPGSYTVVVDESDPDIPPDAVLTTPGSQSLTVGPTETDHVYFGFRVPGGIIAHTFFDNDGDGVWDSDEVPMPSIRVDVSSGAYGSTDTSGQVTFEENPGSYTVAVDESDGDIPTDAVLTTPQSQSIVLDAGETEHVYFGFRVPGTIIAYTFLDDNENGVWDTGEEPLPAIRIDVNNGDYGSTDAAGEVSFSEYPGSYVVDVDETDNDIPVGAVLTTSGSQGVDLEPEEVERVYFGFQIPPATIIAHTYYDNDGDGVWDGDEPAMPSIRVDVSSGVYGSTDISGQVTFEEEPGSYTVEVDDNDGDIPPDATPTNPRSQSVTLDPDEIVHVYFGFHVPSRIIAYTFYDDDGNGVWDAGEDDMPYIRVDLSNGDYGSTNWDGEEIFDVDPGSYTVVVDEDDGSLPSYAVLTTPGSQSVTVDPGEVEEVYFGFRVPGRIRAYTFLDDNGNGTWDSGEDALPNIRVDVSSGASGSTNSSGYETFREWPGTYTVEVDDTDSDIPPGAELTTPQSQSVNVRAGRIVRVYFGFQRLCGIQGGVYFDENDNGIYDAGTDTGLANITVDINCLYGYGGTVSTDGSGLYSLADVPVGTCTIEVDEDDPDLPTDADLVAGDNPATVMCAGEQYLFGVSETWEGATPSGEVFVHVYVPRLAIEEADYRCDELIHLDIQRWSGLAPIFHPDHMPQLCLEGTTTCTVASDVMTERFVVEDIDGDGQAIENLTGKQPTFDYPNGQEVVYNRFHHWGDTNYDNEEYLWILLLSKGGLTPDDGLAAPPHTQALAETGYPGTYQIEGTLYLSTEWTGLFNYEHHWDIPIEFYITQRAPYPQVSPRYLP